MNHQIRKCTNRRAVVMAAIAVLIAAAFTLLIKIHDVQPIGPKGSEVGFAKINQAVASMFPFNSMWYKMTNLALALPILVALGYAIYGVIQLIQRKKISKVDRELWLLAGFYLAVLLVYAVFEKLALNFRPIMLDGELEASFPSTHTLLATCLCGSGIIINQLLVKNPTHRSLLNLIFILLAILVVLGRVLSGVHWVTDIIGGLLISAALLAIFKTVLFLSRQTK